MMSSWPRTLAIVTAVAMTALPSSAFAQQHAQPQSQTKWVKTHRVVVQIDQNDQALFNLALNNIENMKRFYESKGDKVDIEVVAFGAGLNMLRADTSSVKQRVADMAQQKGITFSACGNTMANQSSAEQKVIELVPEARVVPAGVARIVELEEQGWTYLRP